MEVGLSLAIFIEWVDVEIAAEIVFLEGCGEAEAEIGEFACASHSFVVRWIMPEGDGVDGEGEIVGGDVGNVEFGGPTPAVDGVDAAVEDAYG